ncbi:MAG: ExeM/NucH family extracellular endonuclease [Pseudomonadota bacterium]
MAIVFKEDFETVGNGTRYTTSIPEFSDGFGDFFIRTTGTDIAGSYDVSGVEGDAFFAAQDIDGEGAASQQTLTFSGIDISGFENLQFSALFAEDDASDTNEDWDASDFVRVDFQIDGGGYSPLFAIENDGSTFNSAPLIDTDFDGTGDGAEITDAFSRYGAAIAGTGTSLDLRFTFDLNAGDEDIAIDDIVVEGVAVGGGSGPVAVLGETFDDASGFTTSSGFFSDGGFDYLGISDGAGSGDFGSGTSPGGLKTYTGADGSFLTGMDLDGEGAGVPVTIAWTGLDIAGLTDLKFTGRFAEFFDEPGDIDESDFITLKAVIDGVESTILSFRGADFSSSGGPFNGVFREDTDLDGVGDGAALGGELQSFMADISGTGTTLDLILEVSLDAGDEDFAVDDFTIVGQSGGTTPPAVLALSDGGVNVAEEGQTTDSFGLQLATDPTAPVSVTVTADAQTEISGDGVTFAGSVVVDLLDSTTVTNIFVRAVDDALDEDDPHVGQIAFSVASGDGDYDGLAVSPLLVSVADDDVTITSISAVQGDGSASALEGQEVTVEAVVTGLFFNADGDVQGFFLQEEDADADGNAATSEGIFVFSVGATVAVGDQVQVTGIVDEQFGKTEIEASSTKVLSSGNALPTAVAITLATGPDFEALEGMRVQLMSAPDADPLTVVTNFNLDRFGEIQVAEGNLVQPTQVFDPSTQAAEIAALTQANADGRLIIDDSASGSNPDVFRLLEGPDGTPVTPDNVDASAPQLRLGSELGNITGIMDFGFGAYRMQVSEPLSVLGGNPRPLEAPEVGGDLKVASFNVLNYFTSLDDGSPASNPAGGARGAASSFDLGRQTEKLVNALLEIDADIVGLQELENNGFDESSAIASLVAALNARTDPGTYAFVEPVNTDGGFVGTDAITTGLIYKTDAVSLVGDAQALVFDEDSAATTFAVADMLNGFASSDDRVEDFQRNRPAIAATFEDEDGNQVTVAVNHFKSKGDSNLEDLALDAINAGAPQELIDALLADPNYDQGDGQGFWNQVRADASAELAEWLATNPTGAADTNNLLVLGDLNAYAKEDPVTTFEDAGLTDLAEEFIGPDAYSFVFDGQRGTLDYGLASEGILDNVTGVAEWHIAADEPDLLNYSSEFNDAAYYNKEDPFAASDHDPLIIGLDLNEALETTIARIDIIERPFRDKLVYSLDGEKVGSQKLHFLTDEIEVNGSGISIDSEDGLRFSPSFVTTLGEGLGVRSLRGDRFFDSGSRAIDEKETLSFELEDTEGLGDAVAVEFEFATVQGDGDVILTFFDEGVEVATANLSVEKSGVVFALEEDVSFDRVALGTDGHLQVSIGAVEFERIDLGEDAFLFV